MPFFLRTVVLTLIDFGPEAVLEHFLGLLEVLVVLEGVQMRQHPHHLWKAMHLQPDHYLLEAIRCLSF